MRKTFFAAAVTVVGMISSASFGQIIFDNGSTVPGAIAPVGVVTNVGGGFGGADLSRLESGVEGTFGFGHAGGNRLADDFTIPVGQSWTITGMHVFGYTTGATTVTTTAGTLRILNGAPNAGGTVLAGDTTTNVFTGATFTNIYRALSTTPLDANRRLQDNTLMLGAPIVLGPGTYWMEYGLTGNNFVPGLCVPPGTTGVVTGNGLQFQSAGAVYVAVTDGTSLAAKGIPFQVIGQVPAPASLALLGLGGLIAGRRRRA